MARPTKLTTEVHETLVEAIANGHYYESACKLVGIIYWTFRSWILRAEAEIKRAEETGDEIAESEQPFVELYYDVQKAEARAVDEMIRQWRGGAKPEDWRACAEFLSRRYPEQWSPHYKVTMKLSDEELDAAIEEALERLQQARKGRISSSD